MPGQVEMTPELSVVEMNEKRLRIDIKPPKSKKFKLPDKTEEEDEEEYDPPSSAEIEVVHRHPPPDLHSILKQRTVSESSEEVSNIDPDSPRSEGEEFSSSYGKKRSVSFSNHVDHACFKSSASVSSMTPSLKSKRRRQRKREEKKKGHGRCNSEGTSSSEECLTSVSDTFSQSEEEDSGSKPSSGRRAVLHRAVSDPGPTVGSLSTILEREKGSGEPAKKPKRKSKRCEGISSKLQSNDHVDLQTNVGNGESSCFGIGDQTKLQGGDAEGDNEVFNIGKKGDGDKKLNEIEEKCEHKEDNAVDKNKRIISEIRCKLAKEETNIAKKNGEREDSDDDDFVDAVSSLTEEFRSKVDCSESLVFSDDDGEDRKSQPNKDGKVSLIEEVECVTENEFNHQTGTNDNSGEQGKSEVKMILSWDEGRKHMTTGCAVQFSNGLMFDLDVE